MKDWHSITIKAVGELVTWGTNGLAKAGVRLSWQKGRGRIWKQIIKQGRDPKAFNCDHLTKLSGLANSWVAF